MSPAFTLGTIPEGSRMTALLHHTLTLSVLRGRSAPAR